MVVECEAILLGREAIHGTANASALANLVQSLKKRPRELYRRYIVRCSKEHGFQMVPQRRVDDEGFESDEDLTSLGSYDEVADLRTKHQKTSSQCSTDPATASVSSIGTDSANSSGGSDNDDPAEHGEIRYSKTVDSTVESYSFNEIAFCHTDPVLPKIIVWVVKVKTKSKNFGYDYGLEAIVFYCKSDQKYRALYKHFQELSRRIKLDRPMRCKQFVPNAETRPQHVSKIFDQRPETKTYNLVQRIDPNGVTHIEVTRSSDSNRFLNTIFRDNTEPSSIISINTPESGNMHSVQQRKTIESIIRPDIDTKVDKKFVPIPPERPERKVKKSKAPQPPISSRRSVGEEKVVTGQFLRVSVDPSSPQNRSFWLFGNEARPCGTALSCSSSCWYYDKYGNMVATEDRGPKNVQRFQQAQYPIRHRHTEQFQHNNSLPNRFFGKLRELTLGSNSPGSGTRRKRRNSIGELTASRFYQYEGQKSLSEQVPKALTKSTPNLKSVIKNKNGKHRKEKPGENCEPKKVTFSAYATVQVVD